MTSVQDKKSKQDPLKREPLKRGSIETVYKKIKTMMYNQELAPGQKLISKDLAHRLHISTTPILQALHRLQIAKLVRYEKNKGFFVAEITVTEARELYQAREALEVYLVPTLIEKLNEESIQEIRDSFRAQMDKASPNYRRMLMLKDAAFHLAIAKASENQVIVDLLETVLERIYLKYRSEYLGEERIDRVLKQHREILNALRKKDVDKTSQLLHEHIWSGMEHMIYSLENRRVVSL